jgi:hypothetical protein
MVMTIINMLVPVKSNSFTHLSVLSFTHQQVNVQQPLALRPEGTCVYIITILDIQDRASFITFLYL